MPDPSFHPPSHKDIDKLAEVYVEKRNERMEATTQESEAMEALLNVMAKHELQEYRIPDTNLVVKVKQGKHKVSVRAVKEDGEEAEDGDGGIE